MSRLVRISYRELAAKLRRAGYVEIRTTRQRRCTLVDYFRIT